MKALNSRPATGQRDIPVIKEHDQASAEAIQVMQAEITRLRMETERLEPPQKPWRQGRAWRIAMPVCIGDLGLAMQTLEWCGAMAARQRAPGPTLMLCLPTKAEVGELAEAQLTQAARLAFQEVEIIRRPWDLPDQRWPTGTNWAFAAVANACRDRCADFFFWEPDCIPLVGGWHDRLLDEYRGCGRPYMGKFECAGVNYPKHLAGNAVYNWEVAGQIDWHKLSRAWDIETGADLLKQAYCTPLIQQVYIADNGAPPTFQNQQSLQIISPNAVLFHRVKDGSLIRRLREASGTIV